MAQTVTDSVPRWIFMLVFGVLQALLCWIGISTYNKSSATNDIVIGLAVKFDGQERSVSKLETRVDGLDSKVSDQNSRITVLERRR